MTPRPCRPAQATPTAPSVYALGRFVLACVLVALGAAEPAHAQTEQPGDDLAARYRAARARWVMQQRPVSGVAPQGPARLATALDSLRPPPPVDTTALAPPPEAPAFRVWQAYRVPRLARSWFTRTFEGTAWAFLGGGLLTPFDTTMTRDLRARLEARFGSPTLTLADRDDVWRPPDDEAQFEYWIVVNDSIPVVITDAAGPYDRGLVFKTDARFRRDIVALRKAVLGVLFDAPPEEGEPARAPYVDYFYDTTDGRWYRTGFDGRAFFIERARRSRMLPGRRPWLDEERLRRPLPRDASAGAPTDSASGER